MAWFQDDGSSDLSLYMGSDAGDVEPDLLERDDSASRNSDVESPNASLLAENFQDTLVAESRIGGMELEVSLLQDGGDELISEFCRWVPGTNTGLWLGRRAPIGEQAQVLITNVVQCLRGLPGKALREMRSFFFSERRQGTILIGDANWVASCGTKCGDCGDRLGSSSGECMAAAKTNRDLKGNAD